MSLFHETLSFSDDGTVVNKRYLALIYDLYPVKLCLKLVLVGLVMVENDYIYGIYIIVKRD